VPTRPAAAASQKPDPTITSNAAERVAIVVTDFRGDPSQDRRPVPVMQRDQDRILPPGHKAALLDFPK
jgi:hypothetical protein